VKERFQKLYRLPILDKKLSVKRLGQEVRSMLRCRKLGIDCPVVYFVDMERNMLFMEFIPGQTVKEFLYDHPDPTNIQVLEVLRTVGRTLAKMHDGDVVHGDLTTSNMVLREKALSLVLIDFGLSFVSTLAEDKAVDLYVLERAFSSTHPATENAFAELLQAYSKSSKRSKEVIARLDDVRTRGRKKSMVG